MQVGTLFGMNVALSPATFADVPAIPRSPLRASFASLGKHFFGSRQLMVAKMNGRALKKREVVVRC